MLKFSTLEIGGRSNPFFAHLPGLQVVRVFSDGLGEVSGLPIRVLVNRDQNENPPGLADELLVSHGYIYMPTIDAARGLKRMGSALYTYINFTPPQPWIPGFPFIEAAVEDKAANLHAVFIRYYESGPECHPQLNASRKFPVHLDSLMEGPKAFALSSGLSLGLLMPGQNVTFHHPDDHSESWKFTISEDGTHSLVRT